MYHYLLGSMERGDEENIQTSFNDTIQGVQTWSIDEDSWTNNHTERGQEQRKEKGKHKTWEHKTDITPPPERRVLRRTTSNG